jgi:8-oxo-dGTP pyrophosphatase MutT (NUDIX family)
MARKLVFFLHRKGREFDSHEKGYLSTLYAIILPPEPDLVCPNYHLRKCPTLLRAMKLQYLDLLDNIRAIAQLGLNYSKDPYDIERYRRLLDLAAGSYGEITGLDNQLIKDRFSRELGYITPKIGVQGALFDEDGRLLLEHRKDDGLWGLPAGWVETGETPADALIREFREETGLEVEPVALIGLYTRLPGQYEQPHTSIHPLYLCRLKGGTLRISHESLAMEYRDPASVTNWHKDHGIQAEHAIAYRLNPAAY